MSNAPRFFLQQERDLGEVISAAFELLRQDVRGVTIAVIRTCAPAAIGLVASAGLLGISFWGTASGSTGWGVMAGIGGVGLFFSMWAVAILLALAVNSYGTLYRERGTTDFEAADVWHRARPFFWRFLGVNVLVGGASFLLSLLVLVPCLGFLAYLAGALYLLMVSQLAFPVIVNEDVGAWAAMKRGRSLLKNHWPMTLGVVVLTYLLYYLLLTGSFSPLFALLMGIGFLGGEALSAAQGVGLAAMGVLGVAGAFFFQVVPFAAMVVQYFNLVERREHHALAERVERVGPAPVAKGSAQNVPGKPVQKTPERRGIQERGKDHQEPEDGAQYDRQNDAQPKPQGGNQDA